MEKTQDIYGTRAVIEAIKAGKSIDKIFILKSLQNPLAGELEQLVRINGINYAYVPIEKLNRLSNKNHQGVIAKISPIVFVSLDDLIASTQDSEKVPLYLVLDQLSDVRNFGAIIRTAECTGVSGIIIQKKGGAPVNADTVKTSAGAIFNIPICKVDHIKDAIFYLQSSDIKVIAATEKAENTLYNVSFKEPCAILMGSEGRGINPSVLKLVDEQAKLPILGEIKSLNVSVACGAFLYEAIRQRS